MKRIGWTVVVFGLVAGMVYLASLGCGHLMICSRRSVSLSQRLGLTPQQRIQFEAREKEFLAQKDLACQRLCEKRAQLIQLMRTSEPDTMLMTSLTDQITREQTALERGTLEHLLALRSVLTPTQREKLTASIADQLRRACEMTACGKTSGCFVTQKK
mgnify:CR=1 FL=1